MKKLLAFLALAFLTAATAAAALQVDVVTIKPEVGVIEYQVRDDKGTADTADDTIVRHGDQVAVTISETTTLAELHQAARADAQAKGLVPNEG